jgi:hypothetical protein
MKRFIISLLLFISIISAFSQEVTVTSSLDTSRIYIGDQISFSITVEQPSSLPLTLPFFRDTICKSIEIVSGPTTDTSANQGGRVRIIQKYLITSFDSGLYQIPPVFAEIKNVDGLKRFFSDYCRLEVMRVKTAPADTTLKIYDIIKPYRAPVTLGEILPWVLITVLSGILAWAIIRFLRKLKKSDTGVEAAIDPDPAHVIAFRELEKLREEKLWQKGETKNYYTRLTEILRQYLENRFKVYSLELTTAETLDALVKSGFKKNGSYNQLNTVLTAADLVKFAKFNPEPSENESHFQNSWEFIVATKENEVINGTIDEKDKTREVST